MDQALKRKLNFRILSLISAGLFLAHLDRINVGFAAPYMSEDLGLSPAVYGAGASLFFLGYILFELPSNYALHRMGAPRWLGRIMITWGIVACCMAFVVGEHSFYITRVILGAAEAGYVPGALYFLSHWYPAENRTSAVSGTIVAALCAGIFAGPLAGLLIPIDYLGLHGWQWMFLIEGIPPILLGIVFIIFLPRDPAQARWLTEKECSFLVNTITAQKQDLSSHMTRHGFSDIFRSPRVWIYGIMFFFLNLGLWSLVFWMPQLIKERFVGHSALATSLLSTAPYVLGVTICLLVGRTADRTGDRRWHLFILGTLAGTAALCSLYLNTPVASWALLSIGLACSYSFVTVAQPVPATAFRDGALAAGLAIFNSCGQVGGLVGPYMVGLIRQFTGSFTMAIALLASSLIIAGTLPMVFYWAFPRVGRGSESAALRTPQKAVA
ncbi:MFS transporter [Mesorhizobium sp. CN2-181]|uniref:MFS transporter n=1 Tax=Mesorhizobium yinganensis TaxID=3157707 RepID=UPI0032B7769D